MIIVLDSKQVDINTSRWSPTKGTCRVDNLKCAWWYVDMYGYTSMQINYWESKFVDTDELRDILIECLIEE